MIARIVAWVLLALFVVVAFGLRCIRNTSSCPNATIPSRRSTLARSGLVYPEMADSSGPDGCQLKDVVRVTPSDDMRFSAPFLATCPRALGMAYFEHQYLQPAALETYGARVARVEHVGSYACRNVNHQQDAALSQHATANAIDLTGFVLDDSRRITLARWDDASSLDGTFLRRVHENACRSFDTTLGPDYNALHRTHFHVDMGPYRIYR